MREDYSPHGNAWDYFPHDHARSRAYRWGEDGIAGCQRRSSSGSACALALWNGRDPILKERLFGLTNGEGNHGEDVKELYYYLDATPTHSYLKMLYKYPQRGVSLRGARRGEPPPRQRTSPSSSCSTPASSTTTATSTCSSSTRKAAPDDMLMRVTVHNRGPEAATLHVLPQLWFRNTWSWKDDATSSRELDARCGRALIEARHRDAGPTYLLHATADAGAAVLRQRNERRAALRTAARRALLQGRVPRLRRARRRDAVNPARTGHEGRGALTCSTSRPAGRARFACGSRARGSDAAVRRLRRRLRRSAAREADEFYADLQQDIDGDDAKLVQRQAFAGMIWTKQFYLLRRARSGSTATRRSRRRRRAPSTAATATGRI